VDDSDYKSARPRRSNNVDLTVVLVRTVYEHLIRAAAAAARVCLLRGDYAAINCCIC